ncbi:GPP34 family phosphoprotein [Streptomyces sp. NPDC060194]|uniref:GOLPH3/VPS74 family protein n=1 Tax=Streptomyces sp. NPDC060194 TaxID=3347069 RepID=UPI0036606C27
MSTAKELFIVAVERGPEDGVGQGDLSLALAGAEVIDLLGAEAVALDGDRIAPRDAGAPGERLLGEAAGQLRRQPPYEAVADWLWRRGRDLAGTYQSALEAEGELARERGGRLSFGPERVVAADTELRRRAVGRFEAGDAVLTALAAAVGVGEEEDEAPAVGDESVTAVVAAVHDAVMELEAVRQRRTIENTAYANLWRGV